jgi:hypothetical protein
VPVLAAAWDELEPLLNEADQRNLPRDRDIWWRLSVAIRRTIDEADTDEEFQLADALTELLLTVGIFGMGALRDEEKRRRLQEKRRAAAESGGAAAEQRTGPLASDET